MFLKTSAVPLTESGDVPDWAFAATESVLTTLQMVDQETYAHCLRVGEYARKLARFVGLTEYQQKVAQFAGLMHDVGKMGIDAAIIHKPGKLTDEEYTAMREHSELSVKIIEPFARHNFFAQVLPAVRGHHERFDGKGYPDNLHGESIPLLSRVILIVDTLDAMGQDRAYRKGLPIDMIYQELRKYSGTQFDSALVKIFLESHQYWAKEKPDAEMANYIVRAA